MNNIKLSDADASIEMTRSCAVDLTKQINTASADLAGMLKRAHDEKAWQALGYETWNAYLAAEIKLSKQRAHQLMDFAAITAELTESKIFDSGEIPLPKESAAKELKAVPPDQRPAVYAAAVEAAGGQQPTAKQVEAAVTELLPPAKPDVPPQAETPPPTANLLANVTAALLEFSNNFSRDVFIEDEIDARAAIKSCEKAQAAITAALREGMKPIFKLKMLAARILEDARDAKAEASR